MTKYLLIILAFGFSGVFAASTSQADNSLALVGVGASTAKWGNGSSAVAPTSYGAGALLGLSLLGPFDLETGLIFQQRSSSNFGVRDRELQVPVLLRLSFFPGLSLGGGAYGSVVQSPYESFGAASSWRQVDYGWLTSLSISLPIFPGIQVLADGRYSHSLSEPNRARDLGRQAKGQLQGLVGLRFWL